MGLQQDNVSSHDEQQKSLTNTDADTACLGLLTTGSHSELCYRLESICMQAALASNTIFSRCPLFRARTKALQIILRTLTL